MGFSVPRRLRFARWSLTPPFHPYRRLLRNAGGLIFCGTVRRKAFQLSARVYPMKSQISNLKSQKLRGIAPFGVRTFLPRLAPEAILRPSKTNIKLSEIENNSSRESPGSPDLKFRTWLSDWELTIHSCCILLRHFTHYSQFYALVHNPITPTKTSLFFAFVNNK